MSNSDKYYFKDFTSDNYFRLLSLIKQNFDISDFFSYNLNEKFAIIRHDVDFSVHRAIKMAEMEKKLGIRAHYYLLLHSEFYNLLERENMELVNRISELGHHIGLHFDASLYEIKDKTGLESKLILEKNFLESMFKIHIRDFSFHITNEFTSTCEEEHYAGLLNVYSKKIKEKIDYCSDSNGYWKYKRLEEVVQDPNTKNLQILTHPELWQDEVMSPKQRVYRCIDQRAIKTKSWYDNVLKRNGRDNIDW